MASQPRARATQRKPASPDTPNPYPLIPDRNRYKFNAKLMNEQADRIKSACHRKKLDIPQTKYGTHKLVHILSKLATRDKKDKTWTDECEESLVNYLPIREHHRALISHSMFVTMIGTMVARALEEATWRELQMNPVPERKPLDLLVDRHYVRNILCHDSSKTSVTEAVAYSGIMAVHMEKEELSRGNRHVETMHQGVEDMDKVLTSMANVGFKHHYENNAHHLEHFKGAPMNPMSLVEAIVDGLACIFERNTKHHDVASWIGMFTVDKFKHPSNKRLAEGVLRSLKTYITMYDYNKLQEFRSIIFAIIGESTPWGRVVMDECCAHEIPVNLPGCHITSYFE